MDYLQEIINFSDRLKEIKEFTDYQECKNVIEANPQMHQQLKDYKNKVFNLKKEFGDSFECLEQMKSLNNQFADLLSLEEVENFLDAEYKFSRIILNIYDCLADNLDFDLSYINKQ